ncbi:MAG: SDR family oxidoreductase [Leifsonia sp.]
MTERTQYTFTDPASLYADIQPERQHQAEPGSDADLRPHADLGEESYVGSGRLAGRRAVVTGADSGIGAATVIAFAREGAHVAMSYLPSEKKDADRIAALARQAGVTVLQIPGDLRESGYCRELIEEAARELGGLDILVNNGGKQIYNEDLATLTDEQFDDTFKTNVYAMFWITRAALAHLGPGSTIINTTSIQAYSPSEILVDYASTKATINAFTKAIAKQLAPKGIRVNAVAPGPIWTPLQVTDGQPQGKLAEFGRNTPLGRAGQPAEVAPAFVFLASAESSYVIGETLNVNGGIPSP